MTGGFTVKVVVRAAVLVAAPPMTGGVAVMAVVVTGTVVARLQGQGLANAAQGQLEISLGFKVGGGALLRWSEILPSPMLGGNEPYWFTPSFSRRLFKAADTDSNVHYVLSSPGIQQEFSGLCFTLRLTAG